MQRNRLLSYALALLCVPFSHAAYAKMVSVPCEITKDWTKYVDKVVEEQNWSGNIGQSLRIGEEGLALWWVTMDDGHRACMFTIDPSTNEICTDVCGYWTIIPPAVGMKRP